MNVRLILMLALVLVVTSCGDDDVAAPTTTTATTATMSSTTSTSTATTTTAPVAAGRPVLVDTDMAAEGIMSILYLLEQEDLSVRAITVSGTGLVHCDPGVSQALGLLELVGVDGVEVACGPEDPLEGFNAFPTSWRVAADAAYGLDLPAGGQASDLAAPELIVSTVAGSPEPVIVYADGPQTNLAAALRLDPSIAANIERVFIMGGAVDVPGTVNRNPDAEWNIWVDPVAADEVLASGIPITLLPLDATNQVPLTVFHLEALEAHTGGEAIDTVVAMLQSNEQISTGGLYFWDQLLAAIIVDESIGASEPLEIAVTMTGDRSTSGSTVRSSEGHEVDVVLDVNREAFEREFFSTLAGESVAPVQFDPDWEVHFGSAGATMSVPDGPIPIGDYRVGLTNESDSFMFFVVGWLTGDATVEDLEAREGIEQPPFYEVLTALAVSPGSELISVVSFEEARTYHLVALDVDADDITVLGAIEVSG